MDSTWIVTANAGRARVFSQAQSSERFQEVGDMADTAARLRTADTESDRLGELAAGKSRHGVGESGPGNGYEPQQTPEAHQAEVFARTVVDYLRRAQQEGRFQKLVLSASPQFLGVLRKQLNPALQSIAIEISKDYTQLDAQPLQQQIEAHLAAEKKRRSGPSM